jgi:hypothetical protein
MTEMHFVETSDPIDLTTWGFAEEPYHILDILGDDFAEKIGKGIAKRLSDILTEQFKETPPHLYFPFEWGDSDGHGGPPPSDPAMLYVELPLSGNDNDCCFACSLEAAVDSVIDLHRAGGGDSGGQVEDEKGRATCTAIATRLHELAQKLENACK